MKLKKNTNTQNVKSQQFTIVFRKNQNSEKFKKK